jgi:hypothetical protein
LNQELALKRVRYLQVNKIIIKKFLDMLINCKSIRSSNILYDFLTIEDKNEFAQMKIKYKKIPTNLTEFENLEGLLEVKINSELEKEADLIIETAKNKELILNKLDKNFKYLLSDLKSVGNRLKEISNNFLSLEKCSKTPIEDANVVDSYKKLSEITSIWSTSYEKTVKTIDKDLREFYNFYRKETVVFQNVNLKFNCQIIKEHVSSKIDYFNNELNLAYKKQELFDSAKISKWGLQPEEIEKYPIDELLKDKQLAFNLMLPKETTICLSLRRNYAFHLTTLIKEYNRVKKIDGKHFKYHLSNLSIKNKSLFADIFSIVKLLTL